MISIRRAFSSTFVTLTACLAVACSSGVEEPHQSGGSGSGAGAQGGSGGGAPTPPVCEGDLCDSPDRIVRVSQNTPRCFVRASGKAVCVGGSFEAETSGDLPPSWVEEQVVDDAVAAAGLYYHMCFLLASGHVACRGSNTDGVLGDAVPPDESTTTPVLISGIEGITHIVAGFYFMCGRTTAGEMLCWGNNFEAPQAPWTPYTLEGASDVVHAATWTWELCAARSQGNVICTEAPPASFFEPFVEVEGTEGAVHVATGDFMRCAILGTGEVVCWGISTVNTVKVLGVADAAQVAVGHFGSCARRAGGEVVCWPQAPGSDGYEPEPVKIIKGAVDIASFDNTFVAVTASGKVFQWEWGFIPDEIPGLY